jgi:hypothetical protein
MPEFLKKLPVTTQSFAKLIEDNYVYIDKTDLIYNLIDREAVFLSRPRRFGKTLLLNTVAEIFRGNKYLFDGLKISSTNYSFEKYPVVHLDLSVQSDTKENLEKGLISRLTRVAEKEDLNIRHSLPGEALGFLLADLHKKYSQKVVVLIDEYDEPVSSHIDNMELATCNSEVLKFFYSSLKSSNDILRFVLITGVTRYALMGLSAGLNHLDDISFDPQYSAICGFTPTEMDQYLGNRYLTLLNNLKSRKLMPKNSTEVDLRSKLLYWYDGYSYDGENRVLNPISVLKSFQKSKYDFFWYNTAPSRAFISNIFNKYPIQLLPYKLKNIPSDYFNNVKVGELNLPIFLFQTGYLTIDNIEYVVEEKEEDEETITETYNLKVPNFELKNKYYKLYDESLARYLIKDVPQESDNLYQAISTCDGRKFSNIVAALYKGLPAEHHTQKDDTESFYHSILWAYCKGLVTSAKAEEPDSGGDLDLLLVLKDDTHVVIELKYAKDKGQENVDELLEQLANQALKSISSHDYGGHYRLQGKNFITIGLGVFGRGQAKALFGQQPPKR